MLEHVKFGSCSLDRTLMVIVPRMLSHIVSNCSTILVVITPVIVTVIVIIISTCNDVAPLQFL